MEVSNLTWTYWVKSHQTDFDGAFVQKIQALPDGAIRIKTRSKNSGKHEYIITPNFLFESQLQLAANEKPNGFAAFLNKRLVGQKIVRIEQNEWDKVIVIHFHDYFLVIELFAKGNVILCNKDGIILQPYHREEWKDRKLFKDEKYVFPNSVMKNWSHQTIESFQRVLRKDPNRAKALIIHAGISPAIANELANFNANDQALFTHIQALNHQKMQPTQVLVGNEKWLVPFMLSNGSTNRFQLLSQTIDEILQEEYTKTLSVSESIPEVVKVNKREKALSQAQSRQVEARKKLQEQLEDNQQKGQLILLHQAEVDELLSTIKKAQQKNIAVNEIESKLLDAKKKNQVGARLIEKLDLKSKKVILNLE